MAQIRDSDGTPDYLETDSDNDGIPDSLEGDSSGGPDTVTVMARQIIRIPIQIMMVYQIQ